MERNLSSRMTPFAKFVLPIIASGSFGWITFLSFRIPAAGSYPGLMAFLHWLIVGVCLGGTLYVAERAVRLRRVRMNDSGLVVSNYRREVELPMAEIEDVKYERYIHGDVYVTLTFRHMTPLGRRAIFLLPRGVNYRALVAELRRARARAPA